MSQSTKKKHVRKEVQQVQFQKPSEKQTIVKITNSRGNNLHEVATEAGDTFLASMPTKFRKNIWMKRGDFVIVETIPEGDKVKAEIINVLTPDYIRYLKSVSCWPETFNQTQTDPSNESKKDEDELFVNSNRPPAVDSDSDSSSQDSQTQENI